MSTRLEKLCSRFGVQSPEEAIVLYVRELLRKAAIVKPPVPLVSIQRLLGMQEKCKRSGISGAGRLLAHSNGLLIEVKASDPSARMRFTQAHEIGHAMLLNLEKWELGSMVGRSGGLGIENKQEERICDLAASELLMPEDMFRGEAPPRPSLSGLLDLSSRFYVSIQAAAVRACQLKLWEFAYVEWRRQQLEGAPVVFVATAEYLNIPFRFIRDGRSTMHLAQSSCVGEAFSTKGRAFGRIKISFRGRKRELTADCLAWQHGSGECIVRSVIVPVSHFRSLRT